MHDHADVIVIGGGTTGASVAWHLVRTGLSVRLLEKGAIASGSSGASPGIVRQYYADPALSHLAAQGVQAYRDWSQHYPGECGYRQTGFLTGITQHQERSTKDNISLLREQGGAIQWLSPAEAQLLVPDLCTEGLAGLVYEPESGYCDPRLTAQSFALGAQKLGAVIENKRAARQIVCKGGRVQGVQTDSGFIACEYVVNAAGPWASALAGGCAAPLPIVATRQCVGIVAVKPVDDLPPMPGYSDRDSGFYLRPDDEDRYFIGSLLREDSELINPDAFDRSMSDQSVRHYRDRAVMRLRRLEGARPVGSRVSFFDDTPDGNPIVGADPRISGMLVAAGLCGHGFKFAPIFGQAIALWMERKTLLEGMAPFSMERFLR
ncbi:MULTISPECIES: FAD-binding oxidoreductase [unclassified Pseudomonas]|uniref:NAD(P)/FAD-dependent oxidoreductase n=1 Tax=unclassified Pseudomonas TaxID=196821 RepID=UPI0008381A75|nr:MULTISPECIES: FAD-binding oxidoreductase [unclassified Pseudomonas]QIH10755.1 FAD-binding oxidoreductase [Pseudomonas sp. BIOMIG1BAC]